MESATVQLEKRGLFATLKAAISGEQRDLTTGSVRQALVMLAVPMILEMVMESLFAVVDVFYVSRVGTNAVATVGLTESIMMIVYSVAVGLSMSATAFVARRIGEKKPREAADAAVQALILVTLVSIPISLGGIFFAEDILRLMGGSPDLVREGKHYTQIMLGGNIVVMLLFLNNAIFRGAGDAFIAMRVLWVANLLNMVLGPIFIFGLGPIPAMGVTGAAVATTLGRGIGVVYQLYMLTNQRSLVRIGWDDLRVRPKVIGEMLRVSLGGMGQFLIHSASWIFLVRILSQFGPTAVAGYTIAIRIIVFTILPSWGLANAAATLVGQNLGAKKPERAEESVWTAGFYNMLFLTSVSVVFFIFAEPLLRFYSPDPDVIRNGVQCLRFICVGYVLFAYGMVIAQSFNGAGDTRTPTLMNLFCFWVVQIPIAYLAAKTLNYGPPGVYFAQALSFCLEAVIGIYLFRRGKWKDVKI